MAFTSAQKQDIRDYLGQASVYKDLQHRLEGAMDAVGGDADASAKITAWLTELSAIDATLDLTSSTGASYSYGALKKVDEVEFYSPSESGDDSSNNVGKLDRARMLVQRIARSLGVSDFMPAGDYFSDSQSTSFAVRLG